MWAMMGLDQLFFVWKSFLIRCFSDWHNSSNPLRQCHPKNHTRKLFLFFYEDISDNKWLLSILWCEYNFFFWHVKGEISKYISKSKLDFRRPNYKYLQCERKHNLYVTRVRSQWLRQEFWWLTTSKKERIQKKKKLKAWKKLNHILP